MATVSLIVEQGSAPGESASFWFTIARMRPFEGSMTTAVPFHVAQCVNGRLADNGIFASRNVAGELVRTGKGTGRKPLRKRWRRGEGRRNLARAALAWPLGVNLAFRSLPPIESRRRRAAWDFAARG